MWKTRPTEAIPMSDTGNRKSMELMCRQRADADLQNRHKWLAQAERWRELARAENSWRLQKTTQQVMHSGPMATQPNASSGKARQQG
jgi:hypothetical protein